MGVEIVGIYLAIIIASSDEENMVCRSRILYWEGGRMCAWVHQTASAWETLCFFLMVGYLLGSVLIARHLLQFVAH